MDALLYFLFGKFGFKRRFSSFSPSFIFFLLPPPPSSQWSTLLSFFFRESHLADGGFKNPFLAHEVQRSEKGARRRGVALSYARPKGGSSGVQPTFNNEHTEGAQWTRCQLEDAMPFLRLGGRSPACHTVPRLVIPESLLKALPDAQKKRKLRMKEKGWMVGLVFLSFFLY